jgi:hypothetical protein
MFDLKIFFIDSSTFCATKQGAFFFFLLIKYQLGSSTQQDLDRQENLSVCKKSEQQEGFSRKT